MLNAGSCELVQCFPRIGQRVASPHLSCPRRHLKYCMPPPLLFTVSLYLCILSHSRAYTVQTRTHSHAQRLNFDRFARPAPRTSLYVRPTKQRLIEDGQRIWERSTMLCKLKYHANTSVQIEFSKC